MCVVYQFRCSAIDNSKKKVQRTINKDLKLEKKKIVM